MLCGRPVVGDKLLLPCGWRRTDLSRRRPRGGLFGCTALQLLPLLQCCCEVKSVLQGWVRIKCFCINCWSPLSGECLMQGSLAKNHGCAASCLQLFNSPCKLDQKLLDLRGLVLEHL